MAKEESLQKMWNQNSTLGGRQYQVDVVTYTVFMYKKNYTYKNVMVNHGVTIISPNIDSNVVLFRTVFKLQYQNGSFPLGFLNLGFYNVLWEESFFTNHMLSVVPRTNPSPIYSIQVREASKESTLKSSVCIQKRIN